MKKLLALALAMLVVLSMVACGSDAETTAPATETDAPATDAPATDAPATDAPATDAPATDAPATDTQAPETEAPALDPQPANDKAGTVANGVYTNTWAKLTYTIPANLMDMTAMMGASYDGVDEIVGLCAVDMNAGSMVQIMFEKIGYDPEAPTTAKGGIEQLIAECNTYVEEGTTVTASDIVELEIQGITYWGADLVSTSAEASVYTSVLAAEHD